MKNEIIKLYKNDLKIKEISIKLNCTERKVRSVLKENNVLNPYFLSKYSYTVAQPLLSYTFFSNEYASTESIKHLAKKLNCGYALIQSLIKYHNLTHINTPERKRVKELNYDDIIKKYKHDFLPITEISKEYNATFSTIKKILIDENIELRRGNNRIKKYTTKILNDHSALVKIREQSYTLREFSKNMQCSVEFAQTILQKHNMSPYVLSTTRQAQYSERMEQDFKEYIIKSDSSPNLQVFHKYCGHLFTIQKQTINHYTKFPKLLCNKCNPRIKSSLAETEIVEILKKYVSIEQNIRNIITPLELDIFIPSLNIAIEYCGLYWHNELFKNRDYHITKYNMCKERGIRLITIFEDEWIHKKEIVMRKLLHAINQNKENTIFGRKCIIKKTTYAENIDFINTHHIQGIDRAKFYFSLYFNNEMVATMSFKSVNISRGYNKSDNIIEISRYCTSSNIIGGFSKLFKYFEKHHQASYNTIISYSDLRWGDGKVYTYSGFEYVKSTKPNYWYVIRNIRKHRFNFTKKRLIELYPDKENMTEKEIMFLDKKYRIYDCGSALYQKHY